MTFDESNIEMRSLEFSQTPSAEVITRVIGKWKNTYRNQIPLSSAVLSKKDSNFVNQLSQYINGTEADKINYVQFQQNIIDYGLVQQDYDFYIYNEFDQVEKSLTFWGKRLSNSWRRVSFKTFMPAILLQPFDQVQVNLTTDSAVNSLNLLGIVESANYDFKNKSITVEVWLPAVSGSISESDDAYE